ncbi:hypothetical protein [Rhizobium sp. Leaf341]|uniref:hypothetical protein n=1 Tax=Rhizobium sp. Leaf341 TaxID=1736344 RepID=UPI0007158E8B|nr:hypothetical protein [Rhizobium sp. Leaf341]KQR69186.1 hypothetical protein ASG03_08285 [Rhizobium sp. Leaf341]
MKKLKKYLRQALSLIFPSLKSKPQAVKKKGVKKAPRSDAIVAPAVAEIKPKKPKAAANPERKKVKKPAEPPRFQHVPPSFPFHPNDLPSSWNSVDSADGKTLQVLEIRGRSLGELRDAPEITGRLEGVLERFERLSWLNSVALPTEDGDHFPAASPDRLLFGASACFDLADLWFVERETLRLRVLPKDRGGKTFQIVRGYQRDPIREDSVRQLMELPVAPDATTFIDVKLANPYLPLLISVCEQDGELVELITLPFPSLCRGGPHYGELLARTGKKAYLGALSELGAIWVQSALHCNPGARLKALKIDLRSATGTERIFAPNLLYWLKNVLGIELLASHLPSVESQTVRNYILTSLGIDPDATDSVVGEGGKALRLSVDSIPAVEALMSNWRHGRANGESGFVLASVHDNMPKWLFRPPERLLGSIESLERVALFPEFEYSDSAVPGTESMQPGTAVSAIRFCRFGPVDDVCALYPTMSTGPIASSSAMIDRSVAVPAATAVLNACGHATAAIACLEAIALQHGVQDFSVLIAGDLADAALIESHLQRRFPGTGRFVAAEDGEGSNAVLNRLAAMVETDLLLILAAPILLHDRRSIGRLASLMRIDDVASASCFLIGERSSSKNPIKMETVFTGWFGEIGSDGQISSVTSGLEGVLPLLPPTSWPVASSSGRLLMVRTREWQQFGGFDEAGMTFSTRFWSNMIGMERFHLLTSSITASLQPRDDEPADVFSLESEFFSDLHQLQTSSVQIRKLVA